jgi:hydroxymethylpyrimidine pyrophosphatase-like HAD family hydrolase
MRFVALAVDYDGTLAHAGEVARETVAALKRLRAAGGLLILASGRGALDLKRVFSRHDLCDRVVAENGGVLFDPRSGRTKLLTRAPDIRLVRALEAADVEPLVVGETMIATLRPHEATLARIGEGLGVELELSFNGDAVMALPPGVNKASGVASALADLGLSPAQTIAVGDGENDLPFLEICARSCAVANAAAVVRERVDVVAAGENGAGVREIIGRLLGGDFDEGGGHIRGEGR